MITSEVIPFPLMASRVGRRAVSISDDVVDIVARHFEQRVERGLWCGYASCGDDSVRELALFATGPRHSCYKMISYDDGTFGLYGSAGRMMARSRSVESLLRYVSQAP